MYLLLITLGMALAYIVLLQVFSCFFEGKITRYSGKTLRAFLIIVVLSLVVNKLSLSISDLELGNRVMHAFGGGFLAFLTCFLVVKDAQLKLKPFQFALFSFLIVMTMGIANEILEYMLQTYTAVVFADSINDTWLDLISNSVGALIAAVVFTPFIRNK